MVDSCCTVHGLKSKKCLCDMHFPAICWSVVDYIVGVHQKQDVMMSAAFCDTILCKCAGNCCDNKELRMEYDEISTFTPPPQLLAEHESLLSDGLSVELTASQIAKTAVLPTVSFITRHRLPSVGVINDFSDTVLCRWHVAWLDLWYLR